MDYDDGRHDHICRSVTSTVLLTVHKRKKQELSEMEKWGWYVILGSSDAFLCIIYGFWFVKKF